MAKIETKQRRRRDFAEDDISLAAKGFLVTILTVNPGELSYDEQLELADCGDHKLSRIKQELREAGYLKESKDHNDKGHFTKREVYSGR